MQKKDEEEEEEKLPYINRCRLHFYIKAMARSLSLPLTPFSPVHPLFLSAKIWHTHKMDAVKLFPPTQTLSATQ